MSNKTTEAASETETSIAVAREFHGAVVRGDIPAVFDLLDPQIEWRAPESLPWGGTFRGHDGVRELFAIFFDQPPEYGLRREVLEHVGSGERVFVLVRLFGRRQGGEGEFEVPEVHVLTIRNGKVVDLESTYDTATVLRELQVQPKA
jgi:hypothetical protein